MDGWFGGKGGVGAFGLAHSGWIGVGGVNCKGCLVIRGVVGIKEFDDD